jgi:hypothetical protein
MRNPHATHRHRACLSRAVALCAAAAATIALSPERGTAQAQFTATVTPNPIVLTAGGSAVTVRVSTTAVGTFREPIVYGFRGLPAGISTGADQTVSDPFPQAAFTFQAGAGIAAGTYSGTLQGTAGTASASVPVTVIVQAQAAPTIHTITPPAVVSGSRRNVLQLHGTNFEPDAVISSRTPGVEVTSARVLGPGLAEVIVAVRPDAPAGRYGLELRNPDGAVAPASAGLIVQRSSALGAPLSVNAVRILSPGPTQIITPADAVHAHALLAVSGIGTIVGTWRVDGVPFERFTRVVSAGRPIEVRSTLPIPTSHMGEHRLELVIDNPGGMQPQHVTFFQSRDSRTALRVIAPAAGDVLGPDNVRLRWTLVPGAAAYQVELAAGGAAEPDSADVVRRRLAVTEWHPSAELLRSIGTAQLRVRVRPVFPGDVSGTPTSWTSFGIEPPSDGGNTPPGAPPGAPPDGPPVEPPDDPPGRGPSPDASRASSPTESSTSPHGERSAGTGPARLHAAALQDSTPTGAELLLSVQGAFTSTAANTDAPPTLGRFQLSGQTDFAGRVLDHQATGDVSLSHDLGSPWDGREESRNWIARFSAPSSAAVRPGVTVGYASPSHFDRTELLSVAGATVTGVQAAVDADVGTAAFYRSVRFGTGGFGSNVEVSTAAVETSDRDRRFVVRVLGLHAKDNGIEGFAPGSVGRAAGAIAMLDLGQHLRLTGEAAFGEYEPEDSLGSARDGSAVKMSADGSAAGFIYTFRVAHTGEGFVNPSNPGFTPAGMSGLTQGELSASRTLFGRATADIWYSHTRGGITEAPVIP